MSGKRCYHHHNCPSGHCWDMKRLYTKEPMSGKFIPVGWFCPHCNHTDFDNVCKNCGEIEPKPDKWFRDYRMCRRCSEGDQTSKESIDRPEGCWGCSDLLSKYGCTATFDSTACRIRKARMAKEAGLLKPSE